HLYSAPRYLHSFPTRRSSDLLSAAINGDTTEAAMLLEREADIADALKQLSGADDLNGIRTLIKAGKAAPATLIDRVLAGDMDGRSEEHTSELQSRENLVCRLL